VGVRSRNHLSISRLKVRFLHGSPFGARGPEPLAPFGFSAFRLCTFADFAHRQKPPLVRFRLVAAGQGEMQVVEQKTESFGRQVLRDSIGTGCSSGVPTKSRGVAQGSPAQLLRDAPRVTSTGRRGSSMVAASDKLLNQLSLLGAHLIQNQYVAGRVRWPCPE
jgi:hypothetical protein